MLRASNRPDECVTAAHRGKLAYIYVRQSSVNQVRHHQESTELQYRLVDRAVALALPILLRPVPLLWKPIENPL